MYTPAISTTDPFLVVASYSSGEDGVPRDGSIRLSCRMKASETRNSRKKEEFVHHMQK